MAISLTSIGNCIGNIQLESTSHSLVKSGILAEASAQLLQLCPTLVTPWTVALQVPLSMGFSKQEYWSRLPFPYSKAKTRFWFSSHHSPICSYFFNHLFSVLTLFVCTNVLLTFFPFISNIVFPPV